MKILFLTEFFAPDSAIGAIRINKLSKYLFKFGHEVTVLCSAKCAGKIDASLLEELKGVSIHRYDQTTNNDGYAIKGKNRLSKVNKTLKNFIISGYMKTLYPLAYIRESLWTKRDILNYYEQHLKDIDFDVIFATYSPRATVDAGIEISCKYNIPLITDLRDLMGNSIYHPWIRLWDRTLQNKAIKESECVFTISNDQRRILLKKEEKFADKIFVLHNGYDIESADLNDDEISKTDENELVLVYTGSIYNGKRDLSPLYFAIKNITLEYRYSFRLIYAGRESELVLEQMRKYGIESILDDRGLVTKSESDKLQKEADIFLVVSWNTKKEQGILTGKFYEGIQNKKSILTLISGNLRDSELYRMNKEYHYGFCYEACRAESEDGLKHYLIECCQKKKEYGYLPLTWEENFSDDFTYSTIAKKLEKKMSEIIERRKVN